MKYKTIYRVYQEDGRCIEMDCMPEKHPYFDNFEDAVEDAMTLNKHLWKFHQDYAGNKHYYVKEIQ